MRNSIFTLSFFALFSVLVCQSVGAERPNVLLILTDNQSFYELSCHGHPHVQTPRIDRFAEESVDFVNFHAPPFCSPSRALLMTGRYAMRSGIHNTIGGVSILHQDDETMADVLGDAGYKTAIFGKWHLGFSDPYHPNQRGFQEAFVHGGGGIGQLEDYYGNDHLDATFDHNGQAVATEGFTSDVLFDRAKGFIRKNQDEPFFCFVSTPATHRPWQSHPEAAQAIRDRGEAYGKNDMALYSMIENIDENVGEILDQLDELELTEKTLVIVATDQGTRRDRLHKGLGYDEYHQVFCMMRFPSLTGGVGRRSKALTGMVDVFPTVLDLCGVESERSLDGRSLAPLLAGKTTWTDERRLIVQCPRGRTRAKWANVSVKSQRWRLVDGSMLFDSLNDPDQNENVFDRYPTVVRSLSHTYEQFWASLPSLDGLLSRHRLGSDQVEEVRLNAMDWYKGGSPWHQLHMPKFEGNGRWAIEVVQAGAYRFELRHHPREAPKALHATQAYVAVGNRRTQITLDEGATVAVIVMPLESGSFDLETGFFPGEQSSREKPWGALFAYVQRIN
jgi:arylsulfatase A-like enzyme